MAPLSAERVLYGLWAAWGASWILAATWSSRTAARPRRGLEVSRLLSVLGAVLLFVRPPLEGVGWRGGLWGRHAPLLAFPGIVGDACILLAMAGFALCWWARLHLGRFWSGFVGVKTDHRIVDTGPFGLVRHPIYLGLTLAALALALVKATPEALLGAALIFAGFALTARREEAFLSAQLGAAAYDDYRRRVPGLGPF